MAEKTFELTARISTESPKAIKLVLYELLPKGSVTKSDDGFLIKAKMTGESARELNKQLLSTLRRAEKKTRLRAEWASGRTVEKFFDYVPKGTNAIALILLVWTILVY